MAVVKFLIFNVREKKLSFTVKKSTKKKEASRSTAKPLIQ